MATWNFDTIFPTYLHGHFSDPQVIDTDGTPNHVLDIARPYTVKLDWAVQGTDACCLDGKWAVTISLESLGEGFEGSVWKAEKLYTDVVPPSLLTNRMWHIDADITNPTTDPDPKKNVTPGVYKLVVLILFYDVLGNPEAMAAFSTGPTLAFFNPGP